MIEVLDHGYVQYIEHWGSDERVIESARMSTQKGFVGWGTPDAPGDEKLLKFLWDNNHETPFEFGGLVLEVRAPIFVFREWHRHRTMSYNEASARYAPLPALDYVPSVDRLTMNASGTNRQAGRVDGASALSDEDAMWFQSNLAALQCRAEDLYQGALMRGVPKELARLSMTVGRYSTMRVSANLRNWLAFEKLRMAEGAQWEIRQYANAVGNILAEKFPRTWALAK